MSSNRHFVMAVLLLVGVVGVGSLTLVWPCYRSASEIAREAEALRARNDNPEARALAIARLHIEQQELDRRKAELKRVPESSDLVTLMGSLSRVIDGPDVMQHTLKAGEPRAAAPGSGSKAMAQPLTVEMTADFAAVFRLMSEIESLPRLLRIASVTIACEGGVDSPEAIAAAAKSAPEAPKVTAASPADRPRSEPTVVTFGDPAPHFEKKEKVRVPQATLVVEAIYEPKPEEP